MSFCDVPISTAHLTMGGITDVCYCGRPLCGFWGFELSPLVCSVYALFTEPSSQTSSGQFLEMCVTICIVF